MKTKKTVEQVKLSQKIRERIKKNGNAWGIELSDIRFNVSSSGRPKARTEDGHIYSFRSSGRWERIYRNHLF